VVKRSEGSIEFRFFRPAARRVFLVGDFNGWQEFTTPMSRDKNGEWSCSLPLTDGIYEYKYLADGEWCVDRAMEGVGWSPFGCNSVTVMPEHEVPEFQPVG
jgi:1,4-alpha-glucan branching enzyme